MGQFYRKQLYFLGYFVCLALAITSLSRLALVLWQLPRIDGPDSMLMIFWGGLRIDLASLSQFLLLPLGLLLIHALTPLRGRWLHRFIRIYSWGLLLLLLLMEISTPTFISEYDVRPNRLFFEYLSSPREVFGMLWEGYFLALLGGTTAVLLTGWLTRRWLTTKPAVTARFSPVSFVSLFAVLLGLVFLARSGIQHRPINPAMVSFSDDRMLNSLPLNSTYSVLYAAYQMKNEASASALYGEIPEKDMLQLTEHSNGLQHVLEPKYANTNKNLIIVVEESLGAQFVGSLGGKNLTPNIDKWKDKSWFFNNLYATGTRSARGLEAITTGFLPSPARPVLKLPKAQNKFFSLAQVLAYEGYDTSFIYGGESHFDNMKGFFLNNGFSKVIDQNDYQHPQFVGNWGVSDEDLFGKALDYLKQPSSRPKFSLIFSSSNHTPFQYPDGKITPYDSEKHTVNNAVKYADFALGQFLDQLESEGMLDNSVVLVVADHDARVFGSSMVPINHFHIPGFIISPDIRPHVDNTLVSQIDLAPTLLSLLGIEQQVPLFGQDLTQLPDDYAGRAIMQYGNNQAYWQQDEVVVLQPDLAPKSFKFSDHKLTPVDHTSLAQKALAYAQLATWSYDHQAYQFTPLRHKHSAP